MNLNDLFRLSLEGRCDEPALEWQGSMYTFGEIDARANRMAAALQPWSANGSGLRAEIARDPDAAESFPTTHPDSRQ